MTIPRENFIHKIDSTPTTKVRKNPVYVSLLSDGTTKSGRVSDAVAFIKADEYDSKQYYIKCNEMNKIYDPHFIGRKTMPEGTQKIKEDSKYSFTKANQQAYEYYVRYVIDNSVGMYRSAQRELDNAQQGSVKDHIVMTEWDSMSESDRVKFGIAKTTSEPQEEFIPTSVKKNKSKKK